jgi:hypothetical protein
MGHRTVRPIESTTFVRSRPGLTSDLPPFLEGPLGSLQYKGASRSALL